MVTWDDELKALAADFVNSGTERLAELADALARARLRRGTCDVVSELQRHFHRLAGAGSTLGYDRISELAREGESVCESLRRCGDGAGAAGAALDRCCLLTGDLRRAFDEASLGLLPPPVPGFERAPRAPMEILVVDPDPAIRALLERLLTQEAMTVRFAGTVEDARATFDQGLPDGAIVDLHLPDGRGYAVVEDLRGRPGGEVPAVLMFSLTNDFLDQTEAVHAGADACFEKPLEWDALVRKLHQLLERASAEVPRVLVVEDDPDHANFVRRALESAGYEVQVCAVPRHFNEALAAFRPDLIVMDIVLPEVSGYDLARYVRQDDQYVTTPIVFLTGQSQIQARIQTAKAGGDDYLIKPVHASLLVASVAARLERARFLKTLLNRDGLTRLLTHTSFMEHAQAMVAHKQREGEAPASLVLVDLDHFKTVNDTYGHQAGDRVLVSLSTLLRRHLRRSDVVGRYGGEEFGILLDHLGEDDGARLLMRLLHEFSHIEHRPPSGAAFRAAFSAGVASLDAKTMDLERWIQAADSALYGAKRAGRARVMTHAEWLASLRLAG